MKILATITVLVLLAFNAFAHDGQEGNGPVLTISKAEREACILIEVNKVIADPIIMNVDGETVVISLEEVMPKCCAISASIKCLVD